MEKIVLWKALTQMDPTQTDMMIDSSGDSFATSPEQAIRNYYEGMTFDQLCHHVMLELTVAGESVTVPDSERIHTTGTLVLLYICDEATALADAFVGDDDFSKMYNAATHSLMIATSKLQNGFEMGLAEYRVSQVTVKADKKTEPSGLTLVKFRADIIDPKEGFPESFDFGKNSKSSDGGNLEVQHF